MTMKKRFITAIAAVMASLTLFCSCGGGSSAGGDLHIKVSKLGYGTEWLNAVVKEYEKKEGVKVKVTEVIGSQGIDALYREMESLSSDADIIFTRQRHFFESVYSGTVTVRGTKYATQFADLSDVYAEKDANGNSIESKMKDSAKDFLSVDGKYYALPWAEGVFGIVRNETVWKKLGYTDADVPKTTDELLALCKDIKSRAATSADGELRRVAPFIYSFYDEYYTTIAPIWFAQYEGSEGVGNFLKGLDPEGKATYNLYAYDGQLKALEFLSELVSDKNGYQHTASKDLTFTDMQSYFLMNQAVFCVNGAWLETEMGSSYDDVEIGFIKAPVISALSEKLSYYNPADKAGNDKKLSALVSFVDAHPENGDNAELPAGTTAEDADIVRDARKIGSYMSASADHLATVPAYTQRLDQAKKFLKFMYSDEGLQIYYRATKGLVTPVVPAGGYDASVALSDFRKGVNAVTEEGYLLEYDHSQKQKIYSLGKVDVYFLNGMAVSAAKALIEGQTASAIVNNNLQYLKTNWKTITGYEK